MASIKKKTFYAFRIEKYSFCIIYLFADKIIKDIANKKINELELFLFSTHNDLPTKVKNKFKISSTRKNKILLNFNIYLYNT